jgi:CubicO group peptidase (beta-lactamase class C family)
MGLLDYEDKVAKYWPEFAQHGKEDIRVVDVLRHDAKLSVLK